MRYLVLVVPLALLAGCIVRTGPYATYQPGPGPGPAAPRAEVYFYGNHFIPESAGGGWCYIDGPHTHDYYPDHDDNYDYDQGYYWYRGPFLFAFFGGHPLPGGGWCFINGPHQHDYHPPSGADWRWNRNGYVYEGQYRPNRPPPATYWARPAPRQDWRSNRPVVRPAPGPARRPTRDDVRPPPRGHDDVRPTPGGRDDVRPGPGGFLRERDRDERPGRPDDRRPDAREFPGRSGEAPGHGNLPPGQGGTPPGQTRPDTFAPPGHERRDEPPGRGRPEFAPGRPDAGPPAREERGGRPEFAPGRPDSPPALREERGRVEPAGKPPAPALQQNRAADDDKAKKKKEQEKKDKDDADARRAGPGRRR